MGDDRPQIRVEEIMSTPPDDVADERIEMDPSGALARLRDAVAILH